VEGREYELFDIPQLLNKELYLIKRHAPRG
jgi:hypothetical protein